MPDAWTTESRALIETLRTTESAAQRRQIFERLLEWSPTHVRGMLPELTGLGASVQELVQRSDTVRFLNKGRAEAYEESRPEPFLRLFSDPHIPKAGKTLLVVFTGALRRPMLPHCTFLQALPSADFDVAILTDPDNLHYAAGLKPGAGTLLEVVRTISVALSSADYRRIVALGTSSGGFPALRAGILMGAERAVSIGGRPMWWPERLRRQTRPPVPFDLLCACCANTNTLLFCVHAGQNQQDRVAAQQLAEIMPVELVDLARADQHNLLYRALRQERLPRFLDLALNGDPATLPRLHRSVRATIAFGLKQVFRHQRAN